MAHCLFGLSAQGAALWIGQVKYPETQYKGRNMMLSTVTFFVSSPFLYLLCVCVCWGLSLGFIQTSPSPLPSSFSTVSAQWWLWIQHQSIATIKCCSWVLRPIGIYHWIILPATYQHTLITLFSPQTPFRCLFFFKEKKLIPLANCCKHCDNVQTGFVVIYVALIFSLLSLPT